MKARHLRGYIPLTRAHICLQAATLNLAGVKHLFLVPRLRSSEYVRMFAEAFPEIRGAHPGELRVEDLPQLRNIVVVDNAEEYRANLAPLHIKGTVDWREILMWREDTREARVQKDILRGLKKEEVISLQFTRYVFHESTCVSVLNISRQRDDWAAESGFCALTTSSLNGCLFLTTHSAHPFQPSQQWYLNRPVHAPDRKGHPM